MTEEEVAKEEKEIAAQEEKGKPEPTVPAPADPSEEPEGKSQVQIAKELVDEMKKQNIIMTENIKKAEKLTAEQLLGGNIPAGTEIKEPTEDEKGIAAAKKLLEGTGFAEQLFPEKKE